MVTIADRAIDWSMPVGCAEVGSSRMLFAKIRDDCFVAVPESKKALCFAPMLILNRKTPLIRGGLAKKYAAEVLGVPYDTVHQEILTQLIEASTHAKLHGRHDAVEVVEALLPFDAGLCATGKSEDPSVLLPFLVPGWVVELLEFQQLRIAWFDAKDLLQNLLPHSLKVENQPFDEESWVLAVVHNIRGQLVELMEHHGFALRQKRSKSAIREKSCLPTRTKGSPSR